jgi:hypothetical protein
MLIGEGIDVLRGLWDEVLTEVKRKSKIEALEINSLSEMLEHGMRSRFSRAFQDTDFANVAMSLQDFWWQHHLEKGGLITGSSS